MYISMKFLQVHKELPFFKKDLPTTEQANIYLSIRLIEIGMSSTMLKYRDENFEYR